MGAREAGNRSLVRAGPVPPLSRFGGPNWLKGRSSSSAKWPPCLPI